MYAAEARGELPKGTAERWEKHTKNKDKLPEKASSDSSEKSASRSASPVPGPDPGRGNLLVKWPLVMNPNGKFGGKFILPADYFGPNLLARRLGKGPGSTQINSDNESPKLVHPMKIAGFMLSNAGLVGGSSKNILDFLKSAQGLPAGAEPIPPVQAAPPSNPLNNVQLPEVPFSGTGEAPLRGPTPPAVFDLKDHLKDTVAPALGPRVPRTEDPFGPGQLGPGSPGSGPPVPPVLPGNPQGGGNPPEQQEPEEPLEESPEEEVWAPEEEPVQNMPQGPYTLPPERLMERRFVRPVVDENGNPIFDEYGRPVMDEPTLEFDVNWFRRTFGPHYGRLEVVLSDVLTDKKYAYMLDASEIDDRLYDLQSAQKRLEAVAHATRTYSVTPYELRQARDQYERAKSRFLRSAQTLEKDTSYMAEKGFSDDFYGYILAKVEQQVDAYRNYNQKYAEYLEKVREAERRGISPPPAFGLGRMLTEEDLRRRIDATIQDVVGRSRTHFVRAKGHLKEYAWGLAQEALRRHGVNVHQKGEERPQGGT